MSRIFSPRYEVRSIHNGVDREMVRFSGTEVLWFRWNDEASSEDDVYDWREQGVWDGPIIVQVVDAIEREGQELTYEQGLFTRNNLQAIISLREVERVGFSDIVDDHDPYMKDRIVYDGKVFSIGTIRVGGEIREQGTTVAVGAEQVRPDELVNDHTFREYTTA